MKNNYKLKKKHLLILIFISIIGIITTISVFLKVKNSFYKELKASFEQEASVISFIIENRLLKNLLELKGVEKFYKSSTFVDRDEFYTFVTPIIKDSSEIRAIAWLPKVTNEKRLIFENKLKIEGFSNILDYDENFHLIKAKERKVYYPIHYSEPFQKNKSMVGFDIATEKERSLAVQRAIETSSIYATNRITFLKNINSKKVDGISIFIPIYKNINLKKELYGFIVGAVVLEKLFKNALIGTPIKGLIANLYSDGEFLYSDKIKVKNIKVSTFLKFFSIDLNYIYNLKFAGREWKLKITPSNCWIEKSNSYDYFSILPMGFILTLFTILYMNTILKKRYRAELLAENKIEELKESEVRYAGLFDNMKNGVAIYRVLGNGEDFIFSDINKAGEKLSKIKKEDIIGKRVIEVFPAIKEMGLFRVFQQVYKSSKPEHFSLTLYKDERISQWVENYIYKLPSGEIVAIYEDISEKRRAEEALKQSELKFKTMANYTSNWEYWISPNEEIIFIAPSCEKITGYTEQEFIQKPKLIEEIIDKNYIKTFKNYIQTLDKNKINNKKIEFLIVKKDGVKCWIEYESHPVFGNDGKFLGYRVSNVDITERKLYEYELKKLNETLEERIKDEVQKNREKDILILQQSRLAIMGEMINAIAHQWRQPLTSVGLITQKLKLAYKKGLIEEKFIDETISKVMKHINFMSNTIDDFRSFFKPNKSRELFFIKDSFEAVLTIIYEQLNYYSIEVIDNITSDIKIDGFKNEFEQVLLNILNNAKDAFINQNKKGKIFLNSYMDKKEIFITIEDEAGGIDEKIIDKIFDPYFTTKHQSKGTGIGLYLAKMIIEENMNGKLIVQNSNRGAKFTIIFNI